MADILGLNEVADKITKDGVKVDVSLSTNTYLGLFATIVTSLIIGATTYFMIKSLFKQ